ncbi:9593_t:CDS:2, partial [Gigaspora rosea]
TFKNDQVAGSCGKLYIKKRWLYLLNPVVGAQILEREISNILIKPMESIFGYIPSLSGDFSAYRYSALLDSTSNTEETSNNNSILINNDFLAKNNAICFELISKRNFSWLLHYESSSQAELNLSKNLSKITQQHLCNLNAYFHTSFYVISHFYYIWRSEHSILRKISLQIEIIYQTLYFLFSWLALGIFYSILFILTNIITIFTHNVYSWPLFYTYIAIIGMQFIFAFGSKPQISSQEANSSIDIIPDIKSFSNAFGKDIVEVSFSCELK